MRKFSYLILLILVFSCSDSILNESERNIEFMSNELDKSLIQSKQLLKKIESERGQLEFDENVVFQSRNVLEETEILLAQLDSIAGQTPINSDYLDDINAFIEQSYPCSGDKQNSLGELKSAIDIKFILITNLEIELNCVYYSVSVESISLSNSFSPVSAELDSIQTVLAEKKGIQENAFISTSLLNQVSVYPLNTNSAYSDFVNSALVGESYSWLQINEMVNNFPIINTAGNDLDLTSELQVCPWNSTNHLLLVNVTNNSDTDKFIKDLSVVFNTKNVIEFRLLGFENLDNDSARRFNQGQSIFFGEGESFTMFYEIQINNSNTAIGDIILSFQNDEEDRFIQIEDVINSIDNKEATPEFVFLSSVVEATLVLNDSKYTSDANLEAIEKRLVNISPFNTSESQIEFLRLLRYFIQSEVTQ